MQVQTQNGGHVGYREFIFLKTIFYAVFTKTKVLNLITDLYFISTNMDDWHRNWVGLLLVNPENKDEKRRKTGRNYIRKVTNTTEGQKSNVEGEAKLAYGVRYNCVTKKMKMTNGCR